MPDLKIYLSVRNEDTSQLHEDFQASVRDKVLQHHENLEKELEKRLKLSEDETIIFRLLLNPRALNNIIESGILTGEETLKFVFALFQADILHVSDENKPRHIVPLEIRKYRNQIRGMTQTTTRPAIKKETLKPKGPATRPKSGDSPNNKTAATQVKRKGPPVKKRSKSSRLITDPQGKKFDPRRIRVQGSPEQRKAARTVIENYERLMNKDYYNFLCIRPKG